MRFFILFGLTLFVGMSIYAQSIKEVAHTLDKHKYGKLYKCFTDEMKQNISKEKLKAVWEGLENGVGKLDSVGEPTILEKDGLTRQKANLYFEQAIVRITLATNENGEIAGLLVSQLGYSQPKYAKNLGVGKKYYTLGDDSLVLAGELVIPVECNKCPVLVLVHGSGPNDMDETIGPNKVFLDLAMGLAAKGVATFRYHKRFYTYPAEMQKQFDLYDETINDAISAFLAIKEDTSLTFSSYSILGHSLGAYALPLIADSLGSQLDGGILFSANARRLEDLIEYQMKYLIGFDGMIDDDEETIVIENTARAKNIREGNYTAETSSEDLLAYWPGTFWQGIATYDPVATLKSNSITPFLLLQGEKDYQITLVDFEIWRKEVGDKSNVQMQSFPGLTHLFTPTDADRGSPQDYFIPNNVDEGVIDAIAEWAKEL